MCKGLFGCEDPAGRRAGELRLAAAGERAVDVSGRGGGGVERLGGRRRERLGTGQAAAASGERPRARAEVRRWGRERRGRSSRIRIQ